MKHELPNNMPEYKNYPGGLEFSEKALNELEEHYKRQEKDSGVDFSNI